MFKTDRSSRSLVARLLSGGILTVGLFLAAASPVAATTIPYIGANFLGGSGDAPPGSPVGPGASSPGALDASGPGYTAGVVPQNNWNDVGISVGTTGALHDSSGAPTGVTLTISNNNSPASTWVYSSDTAAPVGDPNATGDARLMNGYIDSTNNQVTTFTFNNVPAGNYDLITYALPDNGDGRESHYTLTTSGSYSEPAAYYLTSTGGSPNTYFSTNGFVPVTGTSSADYTAGDYIEFKNIKLTSTGTIGFTGTADSFRTY